MPTHSQAIAEALAECGVKYVFGLPGGEITAFIDACRQAGIRFLLTGHESSAALIAQVMGQITGIPGVCAATLGPGATNLVTGVANAFLDRSPLLAVVAQIPEATYESMSHQRVPITSLFGPITKSVSTVGTGDTGQLVQSSLSLASTPRWGPVMLVLPSDIAVQECPPSKCSKSPLPKDEVENALALEEICSKLANSQRPLIIVGLGVPKEAAGTILKLVDFMQTPFVVTPKAKGILPEDHPLFLGVASGMAIDRDIVATIQSADVILGVGFDPVEVDKTWFTEVDVVAIDSVSMTQGDYRPTELIGDIAVQIQKLCASLTKPRPWPEEMFFARRQALKHLPRASESGVSPLGLIEGLRTIFPRNGVVTCDVGSHKLLMGQFWRSFEPGSFFMSNGLSGMGYGIPAAIAAQLAYPDRAVMAVVGDGGMLMMVHDLGLVRELSLPIVIIVPTDNSLSLIRIAQERRGYVPSGVDFRTPDFVGIAKAFGIRGERAESVKRAQEVVEEAVNSRASLLVQVPIDIREYYDLV